MKLDCDKWMHPRSFIKNNIEYRIASCNSIANFKTKQEFVLNQMAFNPHHKFSNLAKEILLLKYDVWYDFINEVEQFLLCNISLDKNTVNQMIIDLADKRVTYYDETLIDEFRRKDDILYIREWRKQHKIVYNYMIEEVKKLVEYSPILMFQKLVSVLNDVMSHTLYELQELDILIFTNDVPGLSIDNICVRLHKNNNEHLLNKIKSYKKIRDFNNILFKNQTSNDIEIKCDLFFDKLKKDTDITYTVI